MRKFHRTFIEKVGKKISMSNQSYWSVAFFSHRTLPSRNFKSVLETGTAFFLGIIDLQEGVFSL
jgi:hypothetical protein